jgi:hypothetical protein
MWWPSMSTRHKLFSKPMVSQLSLCRKALIIVCHAWAADGILLSGLRRR